MIKVHKKIWQDGEFYLKPVIYKRRVKQILKPKKNVVCEIKNSIGGSTADRNSRIGLVKSLGNIQSEA